MLVLTVSLLESLHSQGCSVKRPDLPLADLLGSTSPDPEPLLKGTRETLDTCSLASDSRTPAEAGKCPPRFGLII